MLSFLPLLGVVLVPSLVSASVIERASDPCAEIAGQQYADPALALACLRSFPVNETIKENVLAVVSGALDFFTFEAEQLHSPAPFQESSVNLRAELARIKAASYPVRFIPRARMARPNLTLSTQTDYDFNRDLFNVVNGLNDGRTYQTSTLDSQAHAHE